MKKTNNKDITKSNKETGEAALRKLRRSLYSCDRMVKEGKITEATTVLGKSYIIINFLGGLRHYDEKGPYCYRVIDEFRVNPLVRKLNSLAEEIYLSTIEAKL